MQFLNLFSSQYVVVLVGMKEFECSEAMMQAGLCCPHLQSFMQKLS